MHGFRDFQHIAISVSDRDRALAFYRDLLGFPLLGTQAADATGVSIDRLDTGHGTTIDLISTTQTARASAWLANDLQTGLRHVGFKVIDCDAQTARLTAAGVPFTMQPTDATGGVRISFFKDPDGTLLELVQNELVYEQPVGTPVVNPPPSSAQPLVFDHIAISVSDLDAALAFYLDTLGFPVLGQLFFQDARRFTITNVQVGSSVIELFSFGVPTIANAGDGDPAVLGLKHIGLAVADLDAALADLAQANVHAIVTDDQSHGERRNASFAGPDGTLLTLSEG